MYNRVVRAHPNVHIQARSKYFHVKEDAVTRRTMPSKQILVVHT